VLIVVIDLMQLVNLKIQPSEPKAMQKNSHYGEKVMILIDTMR
jgi:hypothetical protein